MDREQKRIGPGNPKIISQLLDSSGGGFIKLNRSLMKKLGNNAAILIGELCGEYRYWDERGLLEEISYNESDTLLEGCFYSTTKNIEDKANLSENVQKTSFKTLQDAGILLCIRKGLPAKRYIWIDWCKLQEILEEE